MDGKQKRKYMFTGFFVDWEMLLNAIRDIRVSPLANDAPISCAILENNPISVDETLFGIRAMLEIVGYANDGRNEAVFARVHASDSKIASICGEDEMLPIPLSSSKKGNERYTAELLPKPVSARLPRLPAIYGGRNTGGRNNTLTPEQEAEKAARNAARSVKYHKNVWYPNNREKACQDAKAYDAAHPEQVKARRKRYRERHREEISAKRKQYREENRESIAAYSKEYRAAHREEAAAQKRARMEQNIKEFRALGRVIQGVRKARGISQQEVADRIGVTNGTISKWERGVFPPDANLLLSLFPELEDEPIFSAYMAATQEGNMKNTVIHMEENPVEKDREELVSKVPGDDYDNGARFCYKIFVNNVEVCTVSVPEAPKSVSIDETPESCTKTVRITFENGLETIHHIPFEGEVSISATCSESINLEIAAGQAFEIRGSSHPSHLSYTL